MPRFESIANEASALDVRTRKLFLIQVVAIKQANDSSLRPLQYKKSRWGKIRRGSYLGTRILRSSRRGRCAVKLETEKLQNRSAPNGVSSSFGRMDRFEPVCIAAAIVG